VTENCLIRVEFHDFKESYRVGVIFYLLKY